MFFFSYKHFFLFSLIWLLTELTVKDVFVNIFIYYMYFLQGEREVLNCLKLKIT